MGARIEVKPAAQGRGGKGGSDGGGEACGARPWWEGGSRHHTPPSLVNSCLGIVNSLVSLPVHAWDAQVEIAAC